MESLLRRRPALVERLLLIQQRQDSRQQRIRELASAAAVAIEPVDKGTFGRLVGLDRHQGVAAWTRQELGPAHSENDLYQLLDTGTDDPLFLVLDGVTDPHNLGACLRSADAAGVAAVIVPKDNSAPLNATVRKVASGAADTMSLVRVTNLARCLDGLKQRGVWIVGTDDAAGTTLFDQELLGPLAIVLGAEGSGLRRLTKEKCDFLVAIPMAGAISSLNVSVAAGISLFEAVRQRRQQ